MSIFRERSKTAHRLTAVSRGGEKLVEKRLPDGKRRMGFPFKEVFLCLFIRFPSQGQAFHAPARLLVFGWGCAVQRKCRSVTWSGLVQV